MGGRCTNVTVIATLLGVTELVAKVENCWHGSQKIVLAKKVRFRNSCREIMSLEVRSQNNKVLFLVAYRSKEQLHFWDSLQECYNKAVIAGYSYIIIIGDRNADLSTQNGELLLAFVEDNNLTKHINEPTRITELTSSELDQIITNCEDLVSDVAATSAVSYNDHHTVSGKIKFNVKRPKACQRLM